jgi:hypothetical protein
MDNASVILTTLDGHLDHRVRLVLYGRAALQLGFANAPREIAQSNDVDAIVPLGDLDALNGDHGFWDAQEATNVQLRSQGLYITHLFRADQIFLRPDWIEHLVTIERPPTRWLQLFRPHTLDLILTKMMRGEDAQDFADIEFLARHDRVSPDQIEMAINQAVIPDLAELREAFERAKPRVRELVRQLSAAY